MKSDWRLDVNGKITLEVKALPSRDWYCNMKSVKSINPWQSVIQTIYDIVKAHDGELTVTTKEGEGSKFIVKLSLKDHP